MGCDTFLQVRCACEYHSLHRSWSFLPGNCSLEKAVLEGSQHRWHFPYGPQVLREERTTCGSWREVEEWKDIQLPLGRRNGKCTKQEKVFCFNEVLSAWPSAQGLHFFCLFLCFVCWVPITLHLRLSLLYKWGISVLQWSNNLPKVTAQLPELRHGCQGLKAERTKSRVE